ncbi:MAG: hypothetical protein KJO51_09510 [Gramella sp.]|nr:hypothetical protein [Christiangramia sp.]
MLKEILFIAIVLFCLPGLAQKDTHEIIDAPGIENINIDTDEVYLIRIISTNTEKIKIKTHSEGEYFNQIMVNTLVRGNQLNILTEYPQRLAGGYDKLSAHKVFSLEIELEIPEGMNVTVRSNIASVESQGKFRSIIAELKQGYCSLLDFSGSAVINTFSGNILVESSSGRVEARSRNGDVKIPEFLPGRNPLKLTSIDGNIIVRKN